MNKVFLVLAVLLLVFHCSGEIVVETGDIKSARQSDSDINEDAVIEFTGVANSAQFLAEGGTYGTCTELPAGIEDLPDTDQDGVVDKCDNFVVLRPGYTDAYIYSDETYFLGTKVWGGAGDPRPAEVEFTVKNLQDNTMSISATITGTNKSNYIIKKSIAASIPPAGSDTIKVKVFSSDLGTKSASIKFTINEKTYLLGLTASTQVCVGSSINCEKRFNQMSWPATHNSMANSTDWDTAFDFVALNQDDSMTAQLNNGIRGFMLDNYTDDGKAKLCHGSCTWGETLWVPKNSQFASFLDSHPGEIITYILEDSMGESAVFNAINSGGLYFYTFKWSDFYGTAQSPGAQWPKLGWMIDNNKRLVILTSKNTSNNDWYLYERSWGWQNEYNDSAQRCGVGGTDEFGAGSNSRGTSSDPDNVFIMNHFVTSTFPGFGGGDKTWSQNNNGNVFNHGKKCWLERPGTNPHQIIPNFLTVDYYEKPNRSTVINAANQLNQLQNQRLSLP